jgi:hypothetical protein
MPLLLLAALVTLQSAPSPEQVAFNYFATVLVTQYYPRAKRLYLTGQSEADMSLTGPFAACFPGTGFESFWRSQQATTVASVPIAYQRFSVFKRTSAWRTGGLQVRIHRAVTGPGGVYTHLYVYRAQHFIDYYLIKVSATTPTVVEFCRGSVII